MSTIRTIDAGSGARRGTHLPRVKVAAGPPEPPKNIVERPLAIPPMEPVKRG